MNLVFACALSLSLGWLSVADALPENWRDFIDPDTLSKFDESQSRYDTGKWEGDIANLEPEEMPTNAAANAMDNVNLMWPNNTIPYEFTLQASIRFREAERKMITEAMDVIMLLTGHCIKFVERKTEIDFIRFQKGLLCYSDIGRTGGRQIVSFSSACLERYGSIQHELMHVLGFFHEQSRLDRDKYVTINWDNIAEENKAQFAQRAGDTYGLPYDYESVMHYEVKAFAKDALLPTILPNVRRTKLGQQENLSPLDVTRIYKRYKCGVPSVKSFIQFQANANQAVEDHKHFLIKSDTLEPYGTATWLMRDADTMWSLNHTVISVTAQAADGYPVFQDQTTTSNPFGEFSLSLPRNNSLQLVLTFVTAGYYPVIFRNVRLVGSSDVESTFMEPLLFISRRFSGAGIATGILRELRSDYTDPFSRLNPSPSASLIFRSGMNTGIGLQILSIQTSPAGTWNVSFPAGHYTVSASKSGYITMTFTIVVFGGKATKYDYMALSPNLDSSQISIVSVVKCGYTGVSLFPRLHIRGPVESGNSRFHVYFSSESSPDGFAKYVTAYGEIQSSIILKQLAGVYRISVSDDFSIPTPRWDLGTSCAAVQLYTGSKLWAEYFWPNRVGNAWSVVEINGTNLKPINAVNTVARREDTN